MSDPERLWYRRWERTVHKARHGHAGIACIFAAWWIGTACKFHHTCTRWQSCPRRRALGVNATTVSRKVRALEQKLAFTFPNITVDLVSTTIIYGTVAKQRCGRWESNPHAATEPDFERGKANLTCCTYMYFSNIISMCKDLCKSSFLQFPKSPARRKKLHAAPMHRPLPSQFPQRNLAQYVAAPHVGSARRRRCSMTNERSLENRTFR